MTTTLQPFKQNDLIEQKVKDAFISILTLLGGDRDTFYEGSYTSYALGDLIYDLGASPLVGPITQDIFRTSFFIIHDFFTRPGTFEFYLQVFRAVWGDDVDVEFLVPAPGKLLINIHALSVSVDDLLARRIDNNVYFYDEVLDHEDNIISVQGKKGIKTQSEADALIRELHPAGLWVVLTLDIT
jgi:hypothetical protein